MFEARRRPVRLHPCPVKLPPPKPLEKPLRIGNPPGMIDSSLTSSRMQNAEINLPAALRNCPEGSYYNV